MLRKLRRRLHSRQVERRLKANGYEDSALLDAKITAKENGYEVSAVFEHNPAIAVFAEEAARFFDNSGGSNFVEMVFPTNGGRIFTITIAPRKPGVLAPAEVIGRLRKAVEMAGPWFEEMYPDCLFEEMPESEWRTRCIDIRDALRSAMALYQPEQKKD